MRQWTKCKGRRSFPVFRIPGSKHLRKDAVCRSGTSAHSPFDEEWGDIDTIENCGEELGL
jgi:hypothetical protein